MPKTETPNVEYDQSQGDERRRVRAWQGKTNSSDRVYEAWNTKYNCNFLEDYYTGAGQRLMGGEERPEDYYVINLCHPALEQRIPSLMFYRPKFSIKPKPPKADDPYTDLVSRCQVREDTLNTFVDNRDVGFKKSTTIALREAHMRFGIIEVGYDNDTVDNPNANKPLLDESGKPMTKADGSEVIQSPTLVNAESLWVSWIPAKQFRSSIRSDNEIMRCDWVGYYEWVYIEDIKASAKYKNIEQLPLTGRVRRDYESETYNDPSDPDDRNQRTGMVKVWKIWDIRSKRKFVFPDGARYFLLDGEPWKTLPLAILSFYPILGELLPVPPMYNWTSPQDELNETRNKQRNHRRRFDRRYEAVEGKVSQEEIEKLQHGGDGTIIWVPQLGLIRAIEDAPLDRAVIASIPMTREDFNYVSGVPAEHIGSPESKTATQATIVDVNAKIRESQAREIVSEWLGQIGYIMLSLIEEKMALPFWIMQNVDWLSPVAVMEAARIAENWKKIKAEESFGPLNFTVDVDIESMSPATEDLRRSQMQTVLVALANPAIALLLMSSESLLRRFLALHGFRGDKELREVQMALAVVTMALMGGGGKGEGKPGGKGSSADAEAKGQSSNLPSLPDLTNQVSAQMGVG